MRKLLLGIIVIGLGVILFTFIFSPTPEEGYAFSSIQNDIDLKFEEKQTAPSSRTTFRLKDYKVTPLADFVINARVLSTEHYWFGREADVSPVDLALGWGRMADPAVLEKISIRQSSRWYYWSTDNFPIPRREIETHSANMHMVPANDQIKDHLKAIDKDDTVTLKGQLVRIDGDDGWRWKSSLSRNDTGNNACELLYVTAMRVD